MVAPAPGKTPMMKPITDARMVLTVVNIISLKLNKVRLPCDITCWPAWVCSNMIKISLMLKKPITMVVNCMPSLRLTESKVNRYTPVTASTPTMAKPKPIKAETPVFTG